MKKRPLRDIVLIKVDNPKKETKSGILVKKQWDDLPQTGTVEQVGPDVFDVHVGDRVLFARYAAIDTQDTEVKMVVESQIFAILENE